MTGGDLPEPAVEAVRDWLADHDPISRAAFDRINSALIRSVGEAAEHPDLGRNRHLRRADADAVGVFAYEHDVALAELDESVEYVDLHGYAAGEGFVPVLVCLAGDIHSVNERGHRLYHALDDAGACDCQAVTDGGVSFEDEEQDTNLEFNFEDLHFIELRGDGSKLPKRAWGGYSQDFEGAEHVYRHGEVLDHPGREWGVVDIDDVDHGAASLLIFDLDVHKAPEDFDPDDLTLPEGIPVVETQSGGYHLPFMVHEPRGEGAESDFQLAQAVDWDVDIRGSFVSHHIVAPADIPGIGGEYELLNDASIPGVFDPADAVEKIRYRGEPLLEYAPNRGATSDVEIDRGVEPPAEMPACYHRGLQLRAASPDDHPNTHKVNVLTAMCGLAAGYEVDTMVDHFCEDYGPEGADREKTRYQIQHIARKIDAGEYAPPALNTLRAYGILEDGEGCGCSIDYHGGATAGQECDPAAALPIGRLDALSPEERRRYAATRGLEWPDTDEARERLRNAIVREMRAGNATVLDAPTALGKSYTVATEPWRRRADVTGEAPVVHLHATRDARDEAAAHTEASSASGAVLHGRGECCPLAAGDHDPVGDPESEAAPNVPVTVNGLSASEYFDLLCDEKGLPFSTAHALAREYNDQGLDELPCREDGECEAIRQWEGVPRDDDGNPSVDVVHATHQFAYVPTLRRHTNVVLDEQPDYSADLGQDRIRRMVNAYLREIGAPVTTWEAFVSLAKHTGSGGDAAAERDALDDMVGTDPGREWFVEDPDAHALAPDLTRALWNVFRWEEPDENGRRSTKVMHEPPRLDADSDGYAGTWLSVVVDDENTVRSVRNVPDFSQARAVVGLDAHPSMPMWELNAGPALTRDAVLEPEERRLWRRYERGLTVVQVGDATRPRSGSKALEWMNRDRVAAVVERIREHTTGDLTTAIAPQQVETAVRGILAEGGVDAETMHYGEEKSRNDFADESVGYLYGCMDPGDEMILDALAELDLAAQPATAETEDGETVREKGRTFVGPDADVAEAVLASVRENHVAQGAGRYARNPSEPDSGAVVYLHTDAAPTGFVDVEAPGVEWLATETQRAIIDALAERPSATTRDLAEAVGCSKEHIRETLGPLADRGLVARHDRAGAHGADVYRDTGVESARVDLGETANDPLQECNRWSLAIRNPARTASDASGGDGSSTTPRAVPDGGDGPPDEPE